MTVNARKLGGHRAPLSKWVGGVLFEHTSLDGLGFGRLGHQTLSYDNEFTVKRRGGFGWKRRS